METAIIYSDFSTLRKAYIEVKNFLAKEIGVKDFSLKTTIDGDLGCAGDDNLELLEKFVTIYSLDFADFDYRKHFLSEAEHTQYGSVIVFIISLLLLLIASIVKIITFEKVDFTRNFIFAGPQRITLDMTFGDILTWYLIGKYALRADVNFRLKPII